ncbi:hypothetical protein evm_004753 [Chilo suppressalis]|nr:hypothetical protein evm_004753 [Chilo suppressalis]
MELLLLRRRIKLITLIIFCGTADVWCSLPVDLAPEEKIPPPTTLSLTSTSSIATTVNISTSTYATVIPPIPPSNRDRFLTFAESGHHQTFMFAKDNTFIQLDGDIIQRFQLRWTLKMYSATFSLHSHNRQHIHVNVRDRHKATGTDS